MNKSPSMDSLICSLLQPSRMHMDLVCLSALVTKVRVDAIVCVTFCEVHHSMWGGGGGGEGGDWGRVVLCGVQFCR